MGDVELVGLYWTASGPVEIHRGREWSLFDFRDRCAAARGSGSPGSASGTPTSSTCCEQRTLREMRQILDDHGLTWLGSKFSMDWFLDADDDRRKASDTTRRMLFEAAAALDAHHIKVGNIPGTPCALPQLTERFAQLCADAAQQHDARIVYEFMPFDVNVHSVDAALEVVGGAGAANGGIAVDTWHMGKLGIAPDELRAIPSSLLGWVELSDGRRENMPDLVDETVNHRRLPGEGEFEIPAYVEVCREIGYPGPWGVEVLSEELRRLPMDQIFERAYETTAAQFRDGVA